MIALRPVLSVVIPLYGEAGHLLSSVAAIRGTLATLGVTYELVLVDDGSTDDTWERAREAVGRWPETVAVSLARNFGKEAAMLAGIDTAEGEAVLVMDGDLQHPPGLIPDMFARWREDGYEVVNAVKRRRPDEPKLKRAAASLYYRIFEKLAGERLAGSSDFKLLDRRVVDVYRNLPERNLYFRGLVRWLGFRQIDILFDVPPRAQGRSKWSLGRLYGLAMTSIVSFSTVPLHFVTIAGFAFLAIAAALGLQTLYRKLAGDAVEGFTTIILLILFASSVLMIALGIIGQYVAKIYEEVKRRPRYIVTRRELGNRENREEATMARAHRIRQPSRDADKVA